MSTITERTRQHFAQICNDCIAGAINGEWKVNDLSSYIIWQTDMLARTLAGQYDHTFTHLQFAHFLATGECVPLLR